MARLTVFIVVMACVISTILALKESKGKDDLDTADTFGIGIGLGIGHHRFYKSIGFGYPRFYYPYYRYGHGYYGGYGGYGYGHGYYG